MRSVTISIDLPLGVSGGLGLTGDQKQGSEGDDRGNSLHVGSGPRARPRRTPFIVARATPDDHCRPGALECGCAVQTLAPRKASIAAAGRRRTVNTTAPLIKSRHGSRRCSAAQQAVGQRLDRAVGVDIGVVLEVVAPGEHAAVVSIPPVVRPRRDEVPQPSTGSAAASLEVGSFADLELDSLHEPAVEASGPDPFPIEGARLPAHHEGSGAVHHDGGIDLVDDGRGVDQELGTEAGAARAEAASEDAVSVAILAIAGPHHDEVGPAPGYGWGELIRRRYPVLARNSEPSASAGGVEASGENVRGRACAFALPCHQEVSVGRHRHCRIKLFTRRRHVDLELATLRGTGGVESTREDALVEAVLPVALPGDARSRRRRPCHRGARLVVGGVRS